MKKRFFAFFILSVFILNAAGFVIADTKPVKKQPNALLALLPASDVVISLDGKRFFESALPQILSGNKEMLDALDAHADEFKTNTGIDIRQFEQIAVGATIKQISDTDTDIEPVALARGNFNANSLPALAKYASSDSYREEKIGNRTVYMFSPKKLIERQKTTVKNSVFQKIIDHLIPRGADEIAVTAYDANTLAFGKFERLTLMLTDAKSRVDANLLAAVNRNPNAVMSFAAKFPNGVSGFIKWGDVQNLNAIRRISGSLDVAGENVSISAAAKSFDVAHAEGLRQNLSDAREIGKVLLASSKNPQNKIYARLADSVKITRNGSEVLLDLLIVQSDIDLLIGAK